MPLPGGKYGRRAQELAERSKLALDLRRDGLSFSAIAEKMGLAGRSSAAAIVKRAIDRIPQESAEAVRRMELLRLDAMFMAVWPAALKGDIAAQDMALKHMGRRAKFLGLDEPVVNTQVHIMVERQLSAHIALLETILEPQSFAKVLAAYAEGASSGQTAPALTSGRNTGESIADGESEPVCE